MSTSGIEPIIIVHGTYSSASTWWQRNSDFCTRLDSYLADNSSAARCWAHLTHHDTPFTWSGWNSETDRRLASENLFQVFLSLENAADVARYHVVCHSHGGNVGLGACRHLFSLRSYPLLGRSALCKTGLNMGYDLYAESSLHQYAEKKGIYILDKVHFVGSAAAIFLAPLVILNFVWDRLTLTYIKYVRAPVLAWILRTAQRTSARMALGDDSLDEEIEAVDGEPRDFVGEEIELPEIIDDELLSRSSSEIRSLVEKLYRSLPENRNDLQSALKIAITDQRLVHSQYYDDEWVIKKIAELVMG